VPAEPALPPLPPLPAEASGESTLPSSPLQADNEAPRATSKATLE